MEWISFIGGMVFTGSVSYITFNATNKKELRKELRDNLKAFVKSNPILIKSAMNSNENYDKVDIPKLREELSGNINSTLFIPKKVRKLILEINYLIQLKGTSFEENEEKIKICLRKLYNELELWS